MFDSQGRYVIQNYQRKPPFSSFLPGIAGPLGVPVWCCYNNRGQGVCSCGGRDKDHAIMEFSPARQTYLMPDDGVVRAAFLGDIQVTYRAPGCRALVPGRTVPVRWTLTGRGGTRTVLDCPYLSGHEAQAVRAGEITTIELELEEST